MKKIKNGLSHRMRITLIEFGKLMPFLICAVVAISYFENINSLYFEDFVICADGIMLNKPISWFFGQWFEYNIQFVAFLVILSIAIRTCIFNKLAIIYLAFQLFEKSYFQSHELANHELYYLVSAVNIVVCLFFVLKGLQRLTKH